MADVLVTGASGFIGWHLVRALRARGVEVDCLVRKTSCPERLRPLGVRLVYGDVTDAESLRPALSGKTVVYHLAGAGMAFRAEDYYRVNGQGAGNLAEQCARQPNPPVLVFVSSLAAAGPASSPDLRTESEPPCPVSHYGRSKREGELAVRRFAGRAPITVVRPAAVFGEADHLCLPAFRMVDRFGFHFAPTYGKRRFSFLHADDLASLLILAAERGERLPAVETPENGSCDPRGIYYAAARQHPTYHRLGRMLGRVLGRGCTRIISVGPVAVWTVAATYELAGRMAGRPAFFSMDKAREARAGHWACSARKAIDQLGFTEAKSLYDRLRQTAEWYRREGWL